MHECGSFKRLQLKFNFDGDENKCFAATPVPKAKELSTGGML